MVAGKTYIEDLLDLDSDGDDDVFMSEMPLPKAISKNNNVKSYAKEMAAQRETTMNNKVPQGVDPYRNFGNYESHHILIVPIVLKKHQHNNQCQKIFQTWK